MSPKPTTIVPVILLGLLLAGAGSQDHPASPAANQDLYLQGRQALVQGRAADAAELLVNAARLDWRCLAVFSDPRWQDSLPAESCAALDGLQRPPGQGDPGAYVLLRLASLDQARLRSIGASTTSEAQRAKAGITYLRLAVRDHQGSPFAARAALELTERGFCQADAGFPECTELAIKGYEAWLRQYPASGQRDLVIRLLAQLYLDLADKFLEPRPWQSPARAELCRGRALELAGVLLGPGPSPVDAQWAREFIRRIKDSGRPYSMVPADAIPGRGGAGD